MNITFIYADEEGSFNCSLYNCLYPAKYINKLYEGKHHADVFHISALNSAQPELVASCDKADLIVIERNLFGDALLQLLKLFLSGKNVAVIWDDSYENIESFNAAYPFWHDNVVALRQESGQVVSGTMYPPIITQLRRGARIAKAYIGPSRLLAEDWAKYTKTFEIYNYLDMERYPENVEPLFPHDGITIGWCGSLSHTASFIESSILPALAYVTRKYDHVRILCGGDKRVYSRMNIPESRKLFSPFVTDDKWAALQKSIDIGVAPLATPFDRRRSRIKVLEYMVMKIPWIASNFETYEELKEYGKLVDNSAENWKAALCDYVENYESYKAIANTKNYEYALSQSYEKNIDKLLDVYQEIAMMPDRDSR